MIETVWAWFLVTVVVERSVELVTSSALFMPIRNAAGDWHLGEKTPPLVRPVAYFWYHWMTCGYCSSVPAAFLFAFMLPGAWFTLTDNLLIKGLALHGLANLWHVFFEYFRRGRVNSYDISLRHEQVQKDDARGNRPSVGT